METKLVNPKSNKLNLTKGLAVGQATNLYKLVNIELRDVLIIGTSILFFCSTLFFSLFS